MPFDSFCLAIFENPLRKILERPRLVEQHGLRGEDMVELLEHAGDAYARRLDLSLELNAAASNSVVVA